MKQRGSVSVVIATRERPAALERCLAALAAGERWPGEVVIVDQSRDGRTRQLVERFEPDDLPIVYVMHAGSGLGIAQNIAFSRSRFPIVAVTDDDCVPEPDWIAAIERIFALPSAPDGIAGRVLPLGPATPDRFAVACRESQQHVTFQGKGIPWEVGSGNNFAIKREWLERIDGCDERLGPGSPGQGGADIDLFYRLLRAGARLTYEPDVLVYHERTSLAGYVARGGMYGMGVGACFSLYLRQRDRFGWNILRRWLYIVAIDLKAALLRRDWMMVYREVLALWGTLRGMLYGLFVGKRVGRIERFKATSLL